jgi:hypothetical protein
VNAAPPATALLGLRLVSVGAGLLIVNVSALLGPTVGDGFTTVTEAVPADAMSAAAMLAVNCVADTYVVVRAEPFH